MIISAVYHVYQFTEFISQKKSHKSKQNESNDEELIPIINKHSSLKPKRGNN